MINWWLWGLPLRQYWLDIAGAGLLVRVEEHHQGTSRGLLLLLVQLLLSLLVDVLVALLHYLIPLKFLLLEIRPLSLRLDFAHFLPQKVVVWLAGVL